MRLHLVGLPHTHPTAAFSTCAYTQKIRKFGRMMTDAGWDVILYAGEDSDTVCAEHVPLFTESERHEWFGVHNLQKMHPPVWENGNWWKVTNKRAVSLIREHRESERDLVLLSGGVCQQQIRDMLPDMIVCEPFVGYEGVLTDRRAFESEAWRHHVYGLTGCKYPPFWDDVIPNYFDVDEFPDLKTTGGDYVLFIGRVTERKGPQVAAEIAERLGMELVVAGPGAHQEGDRVIGDRCEFNGRYIGALGIEERAEVLAGARCTIVPTLYLEPFGGVAVESMLAGTPVLATGFGAFTETVTEKTGRTFMTMREALQGFEECEQLDSEQIRAEAIARYSLQAVAPRFTRWFDRLETLWGDGWYEAA